MDATFLQSLLPAEAGVLITALTVEPGTVVVALVTTGAVSACPRCGSVSATVHGRYHRVVRDRPCLGLPVCFVVTARKFICRRTDCPRRVFCERLPELTDAPARTTGDLADAHRHIGLVLGGEAGARLATELGLPTSPDTLLRRVKNAPDDPSPRPRSVGLDDWATRTGHTYGTILIDLERGTVIELLPGRDDAALKSWLTANPQVEVITRDRWPAYLLAAPEAAPQAKPVADRFHLLMNVREAVENVLSRVGPDIRAAHAAVIAPAGESPAAAPNNPSPAVPPEPDPAPPTATEQRRAGKREIRDERFRRVKALTAEGPSVRPIARQLRMSRGAVLRYRRLEVCPDWQPSRAKATAVDPFAAFIADWVAAGNRNRADWYRVLKEKGFAGGYDAARRYRNRWIGSSGRPGKRDALATPRPVERMPPSARKRSFRVANPKPDSHSSQGLASLRERNPAVHATVALAEELMAMIRRTTATPLAEWVAKAIAFGDRDLVNLATRLRSDAAAVPAALSEPWSHGQVEGPVGRLKGIKRQMFGRAGMKLLRARVRHKG